MTDNSRREFLKNTTLAGIGTTLIQPNMLQAKSSVPKKSRKVIVAGAGIAGLATAYELMKRGHDVTVLEATGRHGGHVYTVHDGLSDGLYGDFGAEHITNPGYERYREYLKELDVVALPYPRRKNLLRRIDGKFYTEEMLRDPAVLKSLGFNQKEVDFLSKNSFGELNAFYMAPYLDKIKDEYQPFNVGYDEYDKVSIASIYKRDGASAKALEELGGSNTSALFEMWRSSILKIRGVDQFPIVVFRL